MGGGSLRTVLGTDRCVSVLSVQRLASLLIITQLVNQATEVVVPFLVDRLLSAPHRTESEDDPEEDKFRNQSSLPPYPVSRQTASRRRRPAGRALTGAGVFHRACLRSTSSSWCSLGI